MHPARILAITAASVALGTVIVGHFVVVPMLTGPSDLIDANLARSLANPIEARLAEIVVLAALVLAATAREWMSRPHVTTLAVAAAAAAVADRALVLPAAHRAWAKADLVAGRPAAAIRDATTYAQIHLAVAATIAVVVLVLLVLSVRQREAAVASRPEPTPAPVTPFAGSDPAPA